DSKATPADTEVLGLVPCLEFHQLQAIPALVGQVLDSETVRNQGNYKALVDLFIAEHEPKKRKALKQLEASFLSAASIERRGSNLTILDKIYNELARVALQMKRYSKAVVAIDACYLWADSKNLNALIDGLS